MSAVVKSGIVLAGALGFLSVMDPVIHHAHPPPDAMPPGPMSLAGSIACDVAGSSRCIVVGRDDAGKATGFRPVDVSGLSREDRLRLMPCSLEGDLDCRVSASITGRWTGAGLPAIGSLDWAAEVVKAHPRPRPADREAWTLDQAPMGTMAVKDALVDWQALSGKVIDVGGQATCGRYSCLVQQREQDAPGRGYNTYATYSMKAELAAVGDGDLRRMERCNEGGRDCTVRVRGTVASPGRLAQATIQWLDPMGTTPVPDMARMAPLVLVDSSLGLVSGSFRTLADLRSMQHQPVLPTRNSPSGSPWFVIQESLFSEVAVLPHVSPTGCLILSRGWIRNIIDPNTDIDIRTARERWSWHPPHVCNPGNDTDMLVRLPDSYILSPSPYVHPRHQW